MFVVRVCEWAPLLAVSSSWGWAVVSDLQKSNICLVQVKAVSVPPSPVLSIHWKWTTARCTFSCKIAFSRSCPVSNTLTIQTLFPFSNPYTAAKKSRISLFNFQRTVRVAIALQHWTLYRFAGCWLPSNICPLVLPSHFEFQDFGIYANLRLGAAGETKSVKRRWMFFTAIAILQVFDTTVIREEMQSFSRTEVM